MKKILLFIGLLVTIFTEAQLPSLPTRPGYTNIPQKYQWVGMLPPYDTVYSKWGFAHLLINGEYVPYWGNGTMWQKSIRMQLTSPLPGQGLILGADSSTLINFPGAPGSETSFSGTPTVIDLGNLNYFVNTNGPYKIAGIPYPTSSGVVTLPVGSAGIDSGRVDLIVATAAGVGSQQGLNSDNPQAPVPDINTTLAITSVLILEDDTTPATTSSNVLIWNENVGPTAEATYGTTGTTTTNPNANTAGQAFNGTKYITINAMANTSRLNFILDTLNKADYTYIIGRIKLNNAWAAATTYSVRLINGVTLSNAVPLTNWGIIRTTLGSYQTFAIPLSQFTGSPTFTGVVIQRTTVAGTTNWQLDYLQLQNSAVSVTGGPTINVYNSDGTLNSNRLVNGAYKKINWYNTFFGINSANPTKPFSIGDTLNKAEVLTIYSNNGTDGVIESAPTASLTLNGGLNVRLRPAPGTGFLNFDGDEVGGESGIYQDFYNLNNYQLGRIGVKELEVGVSRQLYITPFDAGGRPTYLIIGNLPNEGSPDSLLGVKDGHIVRTVSAGGGGGSGLFPTSGIGTASGNVTADMGSNVLSIKNTAYPGNVLDIAATGKIRLGDIDGDGSSNRLEIDDPNNQISVRLGSAGFFKVNRYSQFGEFTGSASDATVSITSTGTTARSLFVGPPNMSVGAGGSKVLLYVVDSSIVTGNVADLWGKGFQFTRKSEFGVGGAGALSFYFGQENAWNLEISDTLSLQALNADGIAGLSASLGFAKNPAYTGRTAVKSGSNIYDVSSAVLATVNLSGGSTTNNFILRGDYSALTGYFIDDNPNHTDTIERGYGVLITGATTALTPYIQKFYTFSGNTLSGTTRIDSLWFLDGRNTLSTVRQNNVLHGYLLLDPTKQKTAATEALEVYGNPKFVTGNQGNGKIWTSDGNGKGDWVTPAGGGDVVAASANTFTNTNIFRKDILVGNSTYSAGIAQKIDLYYDGSPAHGSKGIRLHDVYNGGDAEIGLLSGGIYITSGGSPAPITAGAINNANTGSSISSGASGVNITTDKLGLAGVSNASAKFEMTSTTQGFLPSRMTTTQKNAISSPAEGLIVYDTTLHKLCVYTGSAWETVTSL